MLWAKGFQKALGTPWYYGINSEDAAARFAANKILYGRRAHPPIPDFRRAGSAMILGANPWLSKGSVITDPRLPEHILGIRERGGRVFVVDPRLTETAKTLRLATLREVKSHNSWMHNSVRVMPNTRSHNARIHPDDAERYGLPDGGQATVTSAGGSIDIGVIYASDVSPGTLAVPHGWVHDGSWQRANAAGGMNSNLLSHEVEQLSGTSVLNAIPVRIQPRSGCADQGP